MCKLPNKSGLVVCREALLSSLSSEVSEHATARRRSPVRGEAAAVWWEMGIQSFLRGLRLCVQAENDVPDVESGGGTGATVFKGSVHTGAQREQPRL